MTEWTVPPPSDEAPLVEWALWYASQGWAVFPCYGKVPITRRGFLDATRDAVQVRSWWSQWPEANIGLPIPAGQAVLDVDPRNGGSDTMHTLQQLHGALPDTLTSLTGGGGQHLFFTTSLEVKNKAQLGDGIDVQAQGSYVIAPPSIHPVTGKRYLWDAAYGPDTLGPEPLPPWLEDLIARNDDTPAARSDPQMPIREGTRETTLMALAGAMQRQGASQEAIRSALDAENQRCVPPLDAADLDRMTRSVGRYAPAPRLEVQPVQASKRGKTGQAPVREDNDGGTPLSDHFNALALVERHGSSMHYCYPWKSWLGWHTTHWRKDERGTMKQWTKDTLLALLDTLKDIPDAKARDAFYRHLKASLNTNRLEGMIREAQDAPGIAVLPEDFDQHPWLLNCTNGTLDLRDGTLRPHAREDLLTKCLDIPYLPDAPCPTWERFLWRIMGGSIAPDDPDASAAIHTQRYEADERARRLIGFLQRAVGYSLTGDTSEHCFFILYGNGRNGKSTLIETIQAMLGSYGKTAEMSTFLARKDEGVRNDLADLRAARFVSASEADTGKRLSESLVKRLTGGERIKARFLFQEHFEFLPQMHVWLAVNDRPIIRGTDAAIWERIRLIPFESYITPAERDKHLGAKLRAELPGLLAWAVRGCLEWQRYHSLREPPEVLDATEDYRQDMDTLIQFIDDCCFTNPAVSVRAGAFYAAYQQWCLQNGYQPDSLTAIGKRIGQIQSITRNNSKGWWYHGIGLYSQVKQQDKQDESHE